MKTRLITQSIALVGTLTILTSSALPVFANPYRAAFKVIPQWLRLMRTSSQLQQSAGSSSHPEHSPSQPTRQEYYPEFNEVWVKNSTNATVWLVVHYMGEYGWTTEGWIEILPREMIPVAATENRYILFYAENDQGIVWDGDIPIDVCHCAMYPNGAPPNGEYYTKYFFEEDLGNQYRTYTLDLR